MVQYFGVIRLRCDVVMIPNTVAPLVKVLVEVESPRSNSMI